MDWMRWVSWAIMSSFSRDVRPASALVSSSAVWVESNWSRRLPVRFWSSRIFAISWDCMVLYCRVRSAVMSSVSWCISSFSSCRCNRVEARVSALYSARRAASLRSLSFDLRRESSCSDLLRADKSFNELADIPIDIKEREGWHGTTWVVALTAFECCPPPRDQRLPSSSPPSSSPLSFSLA